MLEKAHAGYDKNTYDGFYFFLETRSYFTIDVHFIRNNTIAKLN